MDISDEIKTDDRINPVSEMGSFNTYIAPAVAKWTYYIGAMVSVLAGLSMFFSAAGLMRLSGTVGLIGMVGSIIVAIGGILISRIIAEAVVAFFDMRKNLARLAAAQDDTQGKAANAAPERPTEAIS